VVSKTVTYLGASILQEDLDNSNFVSSDANGLVFSPSTDSDDIIAESYTTYAPTDTPNPLWGNVEIEWTRKTRDTTQPFKTTFGLYGVTPMGDVNLIGEQITNTITASPIIEKVTFDLLHSACEANFNKTSTLAPTNKININLPFSYKNYGNVQIQGYTPDFTKLKSKFFTITGSSDGNNTNFAVGPVDVTYDSDMATNFSDIRFWIFDITLNRFIPVPKILIRKVDSTSARYFLEMPVLLQSAVYYVIMTYGGLSTSTQYWLNSPYTPRDNVYQGQLHMHTTNSDGTISPFDAVTTYRNLGYDWVALSDHNFINPDPGVSGCLFIPNVEYNNNAVDNSSARIHANMIGAITPLPYNPASTADLVTEAGASSITYNGLTKTAKEMRDGRISGGTFGLLTGNPKLAGLSIQTCIDYGLGDGCFVQLNHPTWLNYTGNVVVQSNGYHAMAVYNAANGVLYDDPIDNILSSINRFNIGIEDDTHTYYSGDGTTTLPANVRGGTETSMNTTGFTALSSTITSDTSIFHTGSRSLKCVTNGSTVTEGVYINPTVVANTIYTHHVWVFAGLDVPFTLQKYDGVHVTESINFTGTGDWQHITMQFNPGTTNPALGIYTTSASPYSTTFYVDDIICYSTCLEGTTAFHVYADSLTSEDIISNLRLGNYYVTKGDHNFSLTTTTTETSITATTSYNANIEFITTNGIRAQTNNNVTSATYTPTINDEYVRVKATNVYNSGIAWNNPIYVEAV
jgi:hypothetical protein